MLLFEVIEEDANAETMRCDAMRSGLLSRRIEDTTTTTTGEQRLDSRPSGEFYRVKRRVDKGK